MNVDLGVVEIFCFTMTIGKDLLPVIRDFKASDECRTCVPSSGMAESPVKLIARELNRDEHGPFILGERLERGCLALTRACGEY